jgi:hypothetical protein
MRPRLFCDLLSRALIGACGLELFRYPEMTGGEFAKNDPNQPSCAAGHPGHWLR